MNSLIDQIKDVDPSKSFKISGLQINLRNEILRALWRGEHITTSGGIRRSENGSAGCAFVVDLPGGTTQTVTPTPFEIFAAKHFVDGVWDNTYDISLYPGTVNECLPTNIFSKINQTIGSTYYVVLTCNSDGYRITSSTWSLMSSQPEPVAATGDVPPSTFYILLGILFYNAPMVTVYQVILDNINASPVEWTRSARPGAGPFEPASIIYYKWGLT